MKTTPKEALIVIMSEKRVLLDVGPWPSSNSELGFMKKDHKLPANGDFIVKVYACLAM